MRVRKCASDFEHDILLTRTSGPYVNVDPFINLRYNRYIEFTRVMIMWCRTRRTSGHSHTRRDTRGFDKTFRVLNDEYSLNTREYITTVFSFPKQQKQKQKPQKYKKKNTPLIVRIKICRLGKTIFYKFRDKKRVLNNMWIKIQNTFFIRLRVFVIVIF